MTYIDTIILHSDMKHRSESGLLSLAARAARSDDALTLCAIRHELARRHADERDARAARAHLAAVVSSMEGMAA